MAIEDKITKREQDYSQWYLDIIAEADLAEHSIVRGCMVIKPHGFALWENIKTALDKMITETGHKNMYFPIFIPKSLLSKEAEHVKGFAKECAIVTHYRLRETKDGKGVEIDPDAKLEDELIVRPTSETIIYDSFAKWIKSYRDLPLKINQWANIVRWEMRTRLFLRTTEFLWQEGHTAHSTEDEATEETIKMLNIYKKLAEDFLAMPVIAGIKSDAEKFPGAKKTYSIEAMMQDGKALQAGTSHDLGNNFSKSFEISFTDQHGEQKPVWQTSWGVSTRLIGGVIMNHSDDKGLILPPKIAPIKTVIIPIYKSDEEKESIFPVANVVFEKLIDKNIDTELDDRDYKSPGFKFNEWEKKGVPIRIEIGPKDIEKNQVVLVRRDTGEKLFVQQEALIDTVQTLLEQMQNDLFEKAKKQIQKFTNEANSFDEFKQILDEKKGFIKAHWCESSECEEKIKQDTKATIRVKALDEKEELGKCVYCGKESNYRWYFSQAY